MATGTTDFTKIPPSAQRECEVVKDWFPDLPWHYVESYPRPEASRTVQFRSELTSRTKASKARRFAQSMKDGDKFPPMVVTEDGWVLDGLHRRDAMELRKIPASGVIRIERHYEGAPVALQDQFAMMAAKLNQRNGDRMTAREMEDLIASLSGHNQAGDIAKLAGVSVATVKDIMSAKKARDKARDTGLETTHISRTALKSVGTRLGEFTDPSFAEFISLLEKSRVTAAESVHIMDRMAGLGTEQEKVELLRAERTARASQESGVRKGVPLPQQARMHWAFFLTHQNDPWSPGGDQRGEKRRPHR